MAGIGEVDLDPTLREEELFRGPGGSPWLWSLPHDVDAQVVVPAGDHEGARRERLRQVPVLRPVPIGAAHGWYAVDERFVDLEEALLDHDPFDGAIPTGAGIHHRLGCWSHGWLE